MRKKLRETFLKHSHRFVSPWVVLTIDTLIVMVAFVAAYLLRFNFVLSEDNAEVMFQQVFVFAAFCLFFFLLFRTHRNIIRHTSIYDVLRVFLAMTIAVIVIAIICPILCAALDHISLRFSLAILLIAYMSSLLLLVLFRLAVKVVYLSLTRNRRQLENILIFGAGEMGIATLQTISASSNVPYRVVGFIDDNPAKQAKTISGIRVYSRKALDAEFLSSKEISHIILAVQNMSGELRKQVIEQCLEVDVKLLTVPGYKDWEEGRLQMKQIRKVRIEELLQRDPIKIENKLVKSRVKDKVVMVTGAAGSIGGELARQLSRMGPNTLILLDQAETPLFEMEQELRKTDHHPTKIHYLLGDVSQDKNMRKIFVKYRPDIIYHAAAYKHVPMIESNPVEALRVNVFGTRNMALLAFEFNVSSFILVSTDKAVNPTSFMGVSKRLAEIYVQSLGKFIHSSTKFITTRFGNVLGSNGSVIPIFEKQIAAGGPVTVTDPGMTRFFMTIPEACELVLEASTMGQGGEIFVFDMGQQLRILDIAKKMIRLSGLDPDEDIKIVYTGLRPGEKMYEELFSDSEENLPTHHPKIMIAQLNGFHYEQVSDKLEQIEMMLENREFMHVRAVISELVPTAGLPPNDLLADPGKTDVG